MEIGEWNNAEGQLHRVNGPAVIYADGDKEWWQNDRLHRTDGPAIEDADGTKAWYLKGKRLTEEAHRRRMIILELAGVAGY